ncbi:hypothetical protein MBLNU230_g3821t1 [Neophaeotheca triangularis]
MDDDQNFVTLALSSQNQNKNQNPSRGQNPSTKNVQIPVTRHCHSHTLQTKTPEPTRSASSPGKSHDTAGSATTLPVPRWVTAEQAPLIHAVLTLLRRQLPRSLPVLRRLERGPVSVEGAGRVGTNLDFGAALRGVVGGESGRKGEGASEGRVSGEVALNGDTDVCKASTDGIEAETTSSWDPAIDAADPVHPRAPEQWYITFHDLSQRPETAAWIYGSWETSADAAEPYGQYTDFAPAASSTVEEREELSERAELMRGLVATIRAEGLPASIHAANSNSTGGDVRHALEDGNESSNQAGSSSPTELKLDDAPILFGSLHASTVAALKIAKVLDTVSSPEFTEPLVPNLHFIFRSTAQLGRRSEGRSIEGSGGGKSTDGGGGNGVDGGKDDGLGSRNDGDGRSLGDSKRDLESDLPAGFRWSKLHPDDLALVIKRSHIPRKPRTLGLLHNLAIYPEDGEMEELGLRRAAPIAWAFVGLDASLTTLHVEPEWRGLGLAGKLTGSLFRAGLEEFIVNEIGDAAGVGDEIMAHAVVVQGNQASIRVMEGLGGLAGWWCYWVRVKI